VAHLADLLKVIKKQQVKVIVRQPHEPAKSADFLAGKSAARVLLLAANIGAVPQAQDYFSLFDYNVETLVHAFR
jgi:zinc/manganese transport system substrate-binding protein/zinc transport system substrate-binding protein